MAPNAKLFRAVVVLGAALTTQGCEGGKCGPPNCIPSDAITTTDAKRDAGPPDALSDAAPQDVIIII